MEFRQPCKTPMQATASVCVPVESHETAALVQKAVSVDSMLHTDQITKKVFVDGMALNIEISAETYLMLHRELAKTLNDVSLVLKTIKEFK